MENQKVKGVVIGGYSKNEYTSPKVSVVCLTKDIIVTSTGNNLKPSVDLYEEDFFQ